MTPEQAIEIVAVLLNRATLNPAEVYAANAALESLRTAVVAKKPQV